MNRILLAFKELLSYDEDFDSKSVIDIMSKLIEENYVDVLNNLIKKEKDENKNKELIEKRKNWETLIDNDIWARICRKVVYSDVGVGDDKYRTTGDKNKINYSIAPHFIEDYLMNTLQLFYSNKNQIINKIDPVKQNSKNFVNYFRKSLGHKLIDQLRYKSRHNPTKSIDHETLKDKKDPQTGKTQFHEILEDFLIYTKKQRLNKIQIRILELWKEDIENSTDVKDYTGLKMTRVEERIAKEFGVSRPTIGKEAKEIKIMAIDFFEQELNHKVSKKLIEKYLFASKEAKIIAKIVYENQRRFFAKCVLTFTNV